MFIINLWFSGSVWRRMAISDLRGQRKTFQVLLQQAVLHQITNGCAHVLIIHEGVNEGGGVGGQGHTGSHENSWSRAPSYSHTL